MVNFKPRISAILLLIIVTINSTTSEEGKPECQIDNDCTIDDCKQQYGDQYLGEPPKCRKIHSFFYCDCHIPYPTPMIVIVIYVMLAGVCILCLKSFMPLSVQRKLTTI